MVEEESGIVSSLKDSSKPWCYIQLGTHEITFCRSSMVEEYSYWSPHGIWNFLVKEGERLDCVVSVSKLYSWAFCPDVRNVANGSKPQRDTRGMEPIHSQPLRACVKEPANKRTAGQPLCQLVRCACVRVTGWRRLWTRDLWLWPQWSCDLLLITNFFLWSETCLTPWPSTLTQSAQWPEIGRARGTGMYMLFPRTDSTGRSG